MVLPKVDATKLEYHDKNWSPLRHDYSQRGSTYIVFIYVISFIRELLRMALREEKKKETYVTRTTSLCRTPFVHLLKPSFSQNKIVINMIEPWQRTIVILCSIFIYEWPLWYTFDEVATLTILNFIVKEGRIYYLPTGLIFH